MTESDPGRIAGPSSTGADMPSAPDDVVAAAREAPLHWLTIIDPDWTIDAPAPLWALVGQWRTDEQGDIVEWVANPEHRPGPRTLGWPAPTDPIDTLVQQVAAGYAPIEALLAALRDAELTVPVDSSGQPVRASSPDGAPVVPVWSSAAQAAGAGALRTSSHAIDEVLRQLPHGHDIFLNPAGVAPMLLQADDLRTLIAPSSVETGTDAGAR